MLRRWLHYLSDEGSLGEQLCLANNVQAYAKLLRQCTQAKSLVEGRCIHQKLASCDLDRDTFLANLLVNMYGKCGCTAEARGVFDRIRLRNLFSWSNMMAAYAQNGHCEKAVQLYHMMDLEGSTRPDQFIFAGVLHACSILGNASKGKEVHDRITQCGFEIDTVAQNSLLNMYTKCGRLSDARDVFDGIQNKDVVTWNIMMVAYAQKGHFVESLEMYRSMSSSDCVSHVSAISACSSLLDLETGRSIHARIAANGCDLSETENHILQNALINLYGKCGSLDEARLVFKDMKYTRTAIAWNAMIAACAQHGDMHEVLELYHGMDLEGVVPSRVTFLAVIAACSKSVKLSEVHHRIIQTGFEADVVVATALIDSYAKCGNLEYATRHFCRSPEKNAFSWNAMIGGYVLHGKNPEALQLFHEMDLEGVTPTQVTFTVVLGACGEQGDLKNGRILHHRISASDLNWTDNDNLYNALIYMYAKCGSLDDARETFEGKTGEKSLGAWNTVIAGYIQNSRDREALEMYKLMRTQNYVNPDTITFSTLLGACTTLCDLEEGKAVHRDFEASKLEMDDVMHAALVNMYGKCEDLENARRVFDSRKNNAPPVSWNTLIGAYVQCCRYREALELFQRMDLEGIKHVSVTYVSIFGACSNIGEISKGEQIYLRLVSNGLQNDEIGTAVMHMYNKCGRLVNARATFDSMKTRNPICWTAMLAAYSHHVCGEEALDLLCLMSLEGIQPNEINFTSILNACSHGGLGNEALKCFYSMQFDYGISCAPEHCICVIDMLGRAGLLNDAEDWIRRLPFQLDVVAWKSLMNASTMHGNAEFGTRVANEVAKMEPGLSTPYVVISNFIRTQC